MFWVFYYIFVIIYRGTYCVGFCFGILGIKLFGSRWKCIFVDICCNERIWVNLVSKVVECYVFED